MMGVGLSRDLGFGQRRRRGWPQQVKLAPLEQFPLNLFPRFQSNRRRQGQGETDIETRILSLGTNRLHSSHG
jgi:hypothetical protein